MNFFLIYFDCFSQLFTVKLSDTILFVINLKHNWPCGNDRLWMRIFISKASRNGFCYFLAIDIESESGGLGINS